MHRRNLLIALLIVSPPILAQAPEAGASSTMSLEEARALRVRAETLKIEAGKRHQADQEACYKSFLVNDCLATARATHTASLIQARELDKTGRDVEREAHRREVEAKESARAADLPQQQANQQIQAARYRDDEANKAAERERKLADKARQAEEGKLRTAAEQSAHRQKQERRAKEDAERSANRQQ
jgi:hypothetical protein